MFLTKTRARFRWELEPIQFLACGAREAMQRAFGPFGKVAKLPRFGNDIYIIYMFHSVSQIHVSTRVTR